MELFSPAKREFPGSFPEPENGIPSHDTFSLVLGKPAPEAFGQWFVGFMAQFAEGVQGVVAVDGKTLRRSYDRAPGRSALHLINAWAEEQRPVLGQPALDDRSNEVTALPKLLERLTLRDKAVAADARRYQRRIAQQVIEQGGDYALALKGNQGSWHDDVKLFLDDPAAPVAQTTRVGKGPGRIATRIASVSDAVARLQELHDWPGLRAVGKVTAIRRKDGDGSEATRCYLLSQPFLPERCNEHRAGSLGH